MAIDIKIGQSILVKTPPYYRDEYEYVITQSGQKKISANLKGSTKVKKHWTTTEFELLLKHKLIALKQE